jgi:hypothetical protein
LDRRRDTRGRRKGEIKKQRGGNKGNGIRKKFRREESDRKKKKGSVEK